MSYHLLDTTARPRVNADHCPGGRGDEHRIASGSGGEPSVADPTRWSDLLGNAVLPSSHSLHILLLFFRTILGIQASI